jgi:hypothetical protein
VSVHLCIDCLKLPEKPAEVVPLRAELEPEYRPRVPRKIDQRSGPRSQRCTRHFNAKRRADKLRRQAKNRADNYGMEPEIFDELMVEQEGRCAICRHSMGKSKALAQDHDHELAKDHDHDVKKGCVQCMRGALCTWCNHQLLGRLDRQGLLRAISYLDEPPMVRVRRRLGL